jgi:hypothetical protein
MTLRAFQTALADLVASPERCLAARDDPGQVLAAYDLDARERARLANVVWQRGMSANCTVYRATRLIAIATLLPLTCELLGPRLTEELDDYWQAAGRLDIHFDVELYTFAEHFRRRLRDRKIALPWDSDAIEDVLNLEVAMELLRLRSPLGRAPRADRPGRFALAADYRVVKLRFDPHGLLAGARARPADQGGLTRAAGCVVISIADGRIELFVAPEALQPELLGLAEQGLDRLSPWLADAGLARPADGQHFAGG